MTVECIEKIIKKDWIHPLTSQKLKESDIIYLQRVSWNNVSIFLILVIQNLIIVFFFQGGTGFSTTNDKLEGKHERPVLRA